MTLEFDTLPEEARAEIERLRSVNASMGAYVTLVEGALLAAWKAGEPARRPLLESSEGELSEADRALRSAWELVEQVVLRVPPQR